LPQEARQYRMQEAIRDILFTAVFLFPVLIHGIKQLYAPNQDRLCVLLGESTGLTVNRQLGFCHGEGKKHFLIGVLAFSRGDLLPRLGFTMPYDNPKLVA
jgi:hypothetical protein